MKFTYKITTNWHDTDANRCVRPSKIVEYMQETANRQCESSGLPLDKLRDEKGLAFILGALSINIYKPLHAYEEIEVRTWCKEAKSYIFNRYFEIIRDGEKIAEAATTWVLIDLNSKTMVRASNIDFFDGKFYYDEPVDPAALPPKAKISKDASLIEVGKRKITYSDIDYNMHMNNTRYPDMICDFLPAEAIPGIHTMHLEFAREAKLGSTLRVLRGARVTDEGDTVYLLQTINEQDELCLAAEVWVKGEK